MGWPIPSLSQHSENISARVPQNRSNAVCAARRIHKTRSIPNEAPVDGEMGNVNACPRSSQVEMPSEVGELKRKNRPV